MEASPLYIKTGIRFVYREQIELPFFRQYLKDDTNDPLPEAYVFITGLNQWRRFDTWPPRNVREQTLFFHPGGDLTFKPPVEGAPAFDEYVSDPAKPVPFTLEVNRLSARLSCA